MKALSTFVGCVANHPRRHTRRHAIFPKNNAANAVADQLVDTDAARNEANCRT